MCKENEGALGLNKYPLPYNCKLCGNQENPDDFCNENNRVVETMLKQHVCFNCAFWMNIINSQAPPGQIIIGHTYYIAHPYVKRPLNRIKGNNGKEMYIRIFNGELIKSNNVWCKGEIPEQFREQLPDTANFLSLMTFQKLANNNHKCYARGCWNRYHCIRYNMDCEKDGPFNTVPQSYIIGSDECPSFINKTELKNSIQW